MSRIGRAPISIPNGVSVSVVNSTVTVKGPKGQLSQAIHKDLSVSIVNGVLTVSRPSDDKIHRSMHGLYRTLIHNMIVGVTDGFSKSLEINGVGYRATKQGSNLNLSLGYSHPVIISPPPGISFDCPSPTLITINGIDKQLVGSVAANIRNWRIPEPYKGKGIKYSNEHIRRKVGKAGGKK